MYSERWIFCVVVTFTSFFHSWSVIPLRWRKTPLDTVFLYKKGEETIKMPVWVSSPLSSILWIHGLCSDFFTFGTKHLQGGDVALGIDRIVRDSSTKGKTFELVGPHAYQLSELVDFMYKKAHCLPQFGFQ